MHGTTSVLDACHQLLDYMTMHLHVTIQNHASKMILVVHSDASYLYEQDRKSCIAGHYFDTNQDRNAPKNGAILTLTTIIKHLLSLASEAKLPDTRRNGTLPAKNNGNY